MVELLGAPACRTCQFLHKGKETSCHRLPPVPFPILGQDDQGTPTIIGKLAMHPLVPIDGWCGEYKRSLVAPENG